MVNQELSDAYVRLIKKRELYKKATKIGNILKWVGVAILALSAYPKSPAALNVIHAHAKCNNAR